MYTGVKFFAESRINGTTSNGVKLVGGVVLFTTEAEGLGGFPP
jgi:hypothetical protein